MNSDNNSLHQPNSIQQKSIKFSKSLKPLILLAVVLFITVVAGAGGYWLGIRTCQKSKIISQQAPIVTTTPTTAGAITPAPTVSLTTVPVLPTLTTEIPTLTANWKTYIDTRWGVSFKYPETWFYQEVPEWNPPGDSIDFYQDGVTPNPGEADDPTNAVLNSEVYSVSQQTNEQFISAAPQTAGYQKVLNVAGKPAIKTKIDKVQQYYIKLSSTSELLLTEYNEDGAKELDTIISTIKFTNK